MGWLRNFLRARRQKDSVKIMLLLIIAAVGFGVCAVFRGVAVYHIVNSPVEYVVSMSRGDLSGLKEMDNFVAASFQQEESRTFVYQGREYQVSCIILSEEYLSRVYNIEVKGVTETFYFNQPVLQQMGGSGQEFFALCLPEDGDGNAALQLPATVKCRMEEGIFDQENPLAFASSEKGTIMAFSKDTDPADSGESQKIRICFERQDLDKSQENHLEKLGFYPENQEQLLEGEYQRTKLFLQMKYEVLIVVLLAAGAVFAYRYGKK